MNKETKHTFKIVYTIKRLTQDGLLKDPLEPSGYGYQSNRYHSYYNSPEECLEAIKKAEDFYADYLIIPMVNMWNANFKNEDDI